MTRVQFLNDLYRRISSLPPEQAEQHLNYYAEMLADRIEEGMSEEEAVASMEPLEVIVQRIFEDSPPPQSPQPPAYPELPETDGSRFTKVPDKPGARMSVSRAILWVIAIVVALGAAGNKFRQYRLNHMALVADYATVYETAGESSSSPPVDEVQPVQEYGMEWEMADNVSLSGPYGIEIDGAHIGPDGIFSEREGVDIPGSGSVYSPLAAAERFSHQNDIYRPDVTSVNDIQIGWTSGAVDVCFWGGNTIELQEYADEDLQQSQKLNYWMEDGTLHISDGVNREKGLIVYIPAGFCNALYVDTVAADVTLSGMYFLKDAIVNTASGDIFVSNSVADYLSLTGSSGDVTLQGVAAGSVYISMTNGDVYLNGAAANQMDVSLSSGQIVGFAAGYDLELETISGDMTVTASAFDELDLESSSGDVYLTLAGTYNNYVSADTASGNVTLLLPPDLEFRLNFDSASGIFDKGPFALVRSDGLYRFRNGDSLYINVETSSGNLYLRNS